VIRASASGRSGEALGDSLRQSRIEPEFCDRDVTVLMVTPENTESDIKRLLGALSTVTHTEAHAVSMPALPRGEAVLSIRRAVLSRQETVKADDAEGRICGAPTVSCPPAVPIVVSGERITPDATQAFRYYGIDTVSVVKPS
jgi:arginine/lysine/ornithine decarboxylase